MTPTNPGPEPRPEREPPRPPVAPTAKPAADPKTGPKIIPIEDLKKGGTRFVRLLDRPTLEWIVGRAVAAASRLRTPPDADPKAVQAAIHAAAREEVRRSLKQEQWLAPEEEAAKRERSALERAVLRLREELGHTVLRLRLLRTRPSELDTRTLGPEAVEGLEQRTRALLDSLVSSGELRTPAGDPFGAAQGYEVFRARWDEVVSEVVREERRRLQVELERARAGRIETLEARVADLTEELARKEEELASPQEARSASTFKVPAAGLNHADPFFMWRWRFLNWTFLDNVELQDRAMIDPADLEPADLLAPPERAWLTAELEAAPAATATATPDPTHPQDAEDPRRAWLFEALGASNNPDGEGA
jgi:hypothetical protein